MTSLFYTISNGRLACGDRRQRNGGGDRGISRQWVRSVGNVPIAWGGRREETITYCLSFYTILTLLIYPKFQIVECRGRDDRVSFA